MGAGQSVYDLAKAGDSEHLVLKLRSGANANKAGDKKGHKPLHAAVLARSAASVEVLLTHGAIADVQDDEGETPLHYAAKLGDFDCLNMLLQHGADHTVRDKRGCLPVHAGSFANQTDAVERLRDHAVRTPVSFRFFDRGSWVEFDEPSSRLLGFDLGEGLNFTTVTAAGTGSTYIVDFVQMIQINAFSWFTRSISFRVGSMREWRMPEKPFQGIHPGAGNPRIQAFYSQAFVESGGLQSNQSTSSLVSDGILGSGGWSPRGVLREERGADFGQMGSCALPSPSTSQQGGGGGASRGAQPGSGSGWAGPSGQDAPLVVQQLSCHGDAFRFLPWDAECRKVVELFLAGMDKQKAAPVVGPSSSHVAASSRHVTVTAVHRVCHSPARLSEFEDQRRALAEQRGTANEKMAWHGAPLAAVESIALNGFVINLASTNGHLYGCGVYLAPESRAFTSAEFASPDPTGEKHVLLCRTLLGATEVVPFESRQAGPSCSEFDTGVDILKKPTRYVVWPMYMNTHVLPSYIVSFRYC